VNKTEFECSKTANEGCSIVR